MSTGFPTIVRVLPLLVVLVCAGCNKPQRSTSVSPTPAQGSPTNQIVPLPPEPRIAPCSLITNEEVAAIQGAKMLDPKSSEGLKSIFSFRNVITARPSPTNPLAWG